MPYTRSAYTLVPISIPIKMRSFTLPLARVWDTAVPTFKRSAAVAMHLLDVCFNGDILIQRFESSDKFRH